MINVDINNASTSAMIKSWAPKIIENVILPFVGIIIERMFKISEKIPVINHIFIKVNNFIFHNSKVNTEEDTKFIAHDGAIQMYKPTFLNSNPTVADGNQIQKTLEPPSQNVVQLTSKVRSMGSKANSFANDLEKFLNSGPSKFNHYDIAQLFKNNLNILKKHSYGSKEQAKSNILELELLVNEYHGFVFNKSDLNEMNNKLNVVLDKLYGLLSCI